MKLNKTNISFRSIKLLVTTANKKNITYDYDGNLSIFKHNRGYKFQHNDEPYTKMRISDLRVISVDNGSKLDYYDGSDSRKALQVNQISDGGILTVKDLLDKPFPSVNVKSIERHGKVILETSKTTVNQVQEGGSLCILNESNATVLDNNGEINLKGIILHGNNTLHLQQNSGTVNVDIDTEPNINMYISTASIENNNGKVTCGTKINNVTINSGNKHIYPKLYVKA